MKTTLQNWFLHNHRQRIYYLSLLMLILCSFSAMAGVFVQSGWLAPQQKNAFAQYQKTQPSANLIDSLNTSRSSQVDFHVQTISHRHLRISFNNRSGRSIFVKIYDVIGNLIKQENIDRKGKFKKEYDLSDTSSDFYVIEVGDEQYSTVKRLFPN
jgi:hypothetical protein